MSGIVGSKFNHRGSGLIGSLGTDGQHMLSAGAGKTNVFETVAAGGGKINQVVQAVQPAMATICTDDLTTWYDIGLTAAITPSASDSTVLIQASICGSLEIAMLNLIFKLVRDSTDINLGTGSGSRIVCSWGSGVQSSNNYDIAANKGHMFLDSPSSTSEIDYKVQVRGPRDTGAFHRNRGPYDTDADSVFIGTCTITLMEVLA